MKPVILVGIVFIIVSIFLKILKLNVTGLEYFTISQTSVLQENKAPTHPKESSQNTANIYIPVSFTIPNSYHIFQTFNNCGPAALSMALSYWEIQKSQEEIGEKLRPYQNREGNNDDKSVTFEELGNYAQDLGLLTYHRPNGDLNLLKRFIASGVPIMAKTTLTKEDDIGHFRIIKGYDDSNNIILQDDSYQGHNLEYTYSEFELMWQVYGYEYLVIVPHSLQKIAEAVLGENLNSSTAWQRSIETQTKLLKDNPNNVFARFNLSIAYYHTGDYQKAVEEFERVETKLPKRTLWYQLEPILAYYELKKYDRVFELSESVFASQNRAYSELYIIRGNIYQERGELEKARHEYETALVYNRNLTAAHKALFRLNNIPL